MTQLLAPSSTRMWVLALCSVLAGCGDSGGATNPIGPSGGQLSADGARVTVPAGALATETEIGISAASGTLTALPAGTEFAGAPIAFTPHGTRFEVPVRIEVPHDGTATGAMRLDNESDTTWESIPTSSITGSQVLLDVEGFSVIVAVRSTSFDVDAGARDGGGVVGELDAGDVDAGLGTDAGGGDAGPPATCDPAMPGAPTGTASLTGASFTAADVMAVVAHRVDVSTEGGDVNPFRTELQIRFTEHANACGLENAGTSERDTRYYEISLMEVSDTSHPALPMPGTYAWDQVLPFARGTVYFRRAWELDDCMSNCDICTSFGGPTPSGSVTLTTVTPTLVEGSFTFTDGVTPISGTFSAPICGTTEPDPAYCCR